MFSKPAFPDLASSAAEAKASTMKGRQAAAGMNKLQGFLGELVQSKAPAVGGSAASSSGSAGPPAVGGSTVSKSKS
eukprot:5505629-Alexandrium_andersonii.AAC.1